MTGDLANRAAVKGRSISTVKVSTDRIDLIFRKAFDDDSQTNL